METDYIFTNGGIAQRLRTLVALAEELDSIPTTHITMGLTAPVPGHPTPSSDRHQHCTQLVHTNTCRKGNHTH